MQIEYTHVKTITKLDHVYIETIKVEFKRKHRRVTPKIVPAIKLKSRAITFFFDHWLIIIVRITV